MLCYFMNTLDDSLSKSDQSKPTNDWNEMEALRQRSWPLFVQGTLEEVSML